MKGLKTVSCIKIKSSKLRKERRKLGIYLQSALLIIILINQQSAAVLSTSYIVRVGETPCPGRMS